MKKRTSTKSNLTPTPTSKWSQANNKRKLAGRKSKQGTSLFSRFSLEVISLNQLEEEEEIQEPHVKLMTLKERFLEGNLTVGNNFLSFLSFTFK
ncbi:hypothetical protein AHAS_Ahas19G0204500 [Arachis hypogaea]